MVKIFPESRFLEEDACTVVTQWVVSLTNISSRFVDKTWALDGVNSCFLKKKWICKMVIARGDVYCVTWRVCLHRDSCHRPSWSDRYYLHLAVSTLFFSFVCLSWAILCVRMCILVSVLVFDQQEIVTTKARHYTVQQRSSGLVSWRTPGLMFSFFFAWYIRLGNSVILYWLSSYCSCTGT